MNFYLTGTTHWLKNKPSDRGMHIVRETKVGTWEIFYLSTKPRQPGQKPFLLSDEEREKMMRELWEKQ